MKAMSNSGSSLSRTVCNSPYSDWICFCNISASVINFCFSTTEEFEIDFSSSILISSIFRFFSRVLISSFVLSKLFLKAVNSFWFPDLLSKRGLISSFISFIGIMSDSLD